LPQWCPPEPLPAQWLGSVLLGAVNIEQTKYPNREDLCDLLGQTVRFPTPQREQLTRLANPATIDAVLRWNHRQLAIPEGECDLCHDPHTTHYTGARNILKGWCAAIRWAAKRHDKYRYDHYFRNLTQCNGVLRWTGTEIEAHLVPQVNYPPRLRKIITAHLDQLNAGGLTLPDGSGCPLRLRLTRKEQISVRINDT
jgi:hypothetical protein